MKKNTLFAAIGAALIIVVAVIVAVVVFAGSKADSGPAKARILAADGAPLLDLAGFAAGFDEVAKDGIYTFDPDYTEDLGRPTEIHIVQGPEQLAAAIKSEKPEVAVVAINQAAKLFNEGSEEDKTQYKLAAVSTWGLNEIIGPVELGSLADLVGKRLYTFGAAETPGLSLRAILNKMKVPFVEADQDSALQADKVNIVNLTAASDVAAALTKDKENSSFGLLPEPAATSLLLKDQERFRLARDLQLEWESAFDEGGKYPQAGVVVRSDILADPDWATYIYYLIWGISANSYSAVYSPEPTLDVLRDNFGSVAFSDQAAAINAITDGRLDTMVSVVASYSQRATQNRIPVQKYLQVLYDSGDSGKELIGGNVPSVDFWASIAVPEELLENNNETEFPDEQPKDAI